MRSLATLTAAAAVVILALLSPAMAQANWPAWKAELSASVKEKEVGITNLATLYRDKRCPFVSDEQAKNDCQGQYDLMIFNRSLEKKLLEKIIAAIGLPEKDRDLLVNNLFPIYKEIEQRTNSEIDTLKDRFPEPQKAAELEKK